MESFVTPELLSLVAAEHRRGRFLVLVTTTLDAQQAVLWDMRLITH